MMAGHIGQIRNHEYWMRCPFCGDSRFHRNKCHFSINLRTGLYNCHRCNAGGKFTTAEVYSLTGQYQKLITSSSTAPATLSEEERREVDLGVLERMLLPGPGTARHSLLDRFHITTSINGRSQTLDVFKLRNVRGQLVGFNVRGKDYHRTIGHRGLAYVGDYLAGFSVRLVEGPYDVVDAIDVATVGFPTKAQLRQLKSYSLVLCPDGDVLGSNMLAIRYFRSFTARKGPLVSQLELLPDGLDPDDVDPEDRRVIVFDRRKVAFLVKELDADRLDITEWVREAI